MYDPPVVVSTNLHWGVQLGTKIPDIGPLKPYPQGAWQYLILTSLYDKKRLMIVPLIVMAYWYRKCSKIFSWDTNMGKVCQAFHLPRVWMRESSIPFAAAVDAASMQKLWPEYEEPSMPAWHKWAQYLSTNLLLVSGEPSLNGTANLGPFRAEQDGSAEPIQGIVSVQFYINFQDG